MRQFFLLSLSLLLRFSLYAALPTVETLSLEEKVGQILMIHFQGEIANQDAQVLVNDVKVGAIIYYTWANTLKDPVQVQKLSNSLQNLAKQNPTPIPLLIAIDQEGGAVTRLTQGFTPFPGNQAIAKTHDLTLAKKCACAMGEELRSVGINMNLAPVADIVRTPHAAIGIRSFGQCPECVALFTEAFLEGFHQAKIITSLKHFPGYGGVTVDAHEDLPHLLVSQTDLEACELVPYYKLAKKADTIMTGHILVSALDSKNCATLSPTILTGLLRDQMGFNGLVISDSLAMEGFLKNCNSLEEGAISAINAGCDMLILGGKQLIGEKKNLEFGPSVAQKLAHTLAHSVKTGVISEERLNEAVRKILTLKADYDLFAFYLPDESAIEKCVHTKENQDLVEKIRLTDH